MLLEGLMSLQEEGAALSLPRRVLGVIRGRATALLHDPIIQVLPLLLHLFLHFLLLLLLLLRLRNTRATRDLIDHLRDSMLVIGRVLTLVLLQLQLLLDHGRNEGTRTRPAHAHAKVVPLVHKVAHPQESWVIVGLQELGMDHLARAVHKARHGRRIEHVEVLLHDQAFVEGRLRVEDGAHLLESLVLDQLSRCHINRAQVATRVVVPITPQKQGHSLVLITQVVQKLGNLRLEHVAVRLEGCLVLVKERLRLNFIAQGDTYQALILAQIVHKGTCGCLQERILLLPILGPLVLGHDLIQLIGQLERVRLGTRNLPQYLIVDTQ